MHEAPPDPGPAPAASSRRSGSGSCLSILAVGVIGGVVGALVTAAVLAAIWQPFSGTDAESPAGTATQTPQPGITIEVPDEDLSFAEAVAVKAMPSVVSVAIEQSVYDPFTGRRSTQVVGNGSGVIIRQDGYIITNDHVVEGADAISVTVGVDTLSATIVGRDPSSDLAVLKVDRSGLPRHRGRLLGRPACRPAGGGDRQPLRTRPVTHHRRDLGAWTHQLQGER